MSFHGVSSQRRRNVTQPKVTQAQKTRNNEKLFGVARNFNFQLLKLGESFYTYIHSHSSYMIHEKQIVPLCRHTAMLLCR